jgi:hypothetical protein
MTKDEINAAVLQLSTKTGVSISNIKALIPTLVEEANEKKAKKTLVDQEVEVVVSSQSHTGAEASATGFSTSTTGLEISLNGGAIVATLLDVGGGIAAADLFCFKTEVKNFKFESGGLFLGA